MYVLQVHVFEFDIQKFSRAILICMKQLTKHHQIFFNGICIADPFLQQSGKFCVKNLPSRKSGDNHIDATIMREACADGCQRTKTTGTHRLIVFQTLNKDFIHVLGATHNKFHAQHRCLPTNVLKCRRRNESVVERKSENFQSEFDQTMKNVRAVLPAAEQQHAAKIGRRSVFCCTTNQLI